MLCLPGKYSGEEKLMWCGIKTPLDKIFNILFYDIKFYSCRSGCCCPRGTHTYHISSNCQTPGVPNHHISRWHRCDRLPSCYPLSPASGYYKLKQPSSSVNHHYLSMPQLVKQLQNVHCGHRLVSKQCETLTKKLEKNVSNEEWLLAVTLMRG